MIRSKDISEGESVLVLRANVHGREISSGIGIVSKLDEIAEYAHSHGVKLVILPMGNPSGYETMNYRNIEVTEKRLDLAPDYPGNNVSCSYIVATTSPDGTRTEREVGDIGDAKTTLDETTGLPFEVVGWKSALENSYAKNLPNEARAALEAVADLNLSDVKGCIDFHADHFSVLPTSYQYGFTTDTGKYAPIIEKVNEVVTVWKNIDCEKNPYLMEGYCSDIFLPGEEGKGSYTATAPAEETADQGFREVTDSLGFVVHHDGTFPCIFERAGAPHCITLEISAVTPQQDVEKVMMHWIRGVVDLIEHDKIAS
jgi:hypothetical protein